MQYYPLLPLSSLNLLYKNPEIVDNGPHEFF